MPIKLIPDLEWEFIKKIDVIESDKGVTIYCVKEAEDENETTQVTKVSEPEIDIKTTENIKPVVTEAVEAPEDTQVTEVAKTIEDTNITEDAEHREITKEAEPTGNTGIAQAVLVDPKEDTETTEVSEQVAPEEIEVTETADTIKITEVATDVTELIVAVTPREKKESKNCSTIMTTPPRSPQREKPEIQSNSEDITEVDAETEQATKKMHKYPETNKSLVSKIFSVFRQAKESNPQPAPEYGLQM